MKSIPLSMFEQTHAAFKGDSKPIFKRCFECQGQCEYNKVGTLLPGEKEYMAKQMNMSVDEFADRYLDILIVDGERLDVLKFVEPCRFLSPTFECTCRDFKVLMCEIYPIVFEVRSGKVEYFLDDACPLVKDEELRDYFNNVGIPAFSKLPIPLKWFECVERYDPLNFDYQKLQKHRKSWDRCEEFRLEDLIRWGAREDIIC